MVPETEQHNSKLSLLELSPILVPYFLGFFIFRGFFSNFPLYLQITQGLSDLETVELWSLISGVALLVGAITRIPSGILSDRIGRFNALILSYLVYSLSLLIILFTKSTIWYLLGVTTIRFGLNIIAMTGRSIVSTSRRDRGLKNGLLSSMVGMGSFLGPYTLAYILDHYPADWIIWASILIIIIDFLIFIVMFSIVPKLLEKWYPDTQIDLNLELMEVNVLDAFKSGIKREGVQESFILFFNAGMIYGLITSIFTIYGYNILNISITLLGFITGIGSFIQVFWAPIIGKIYQYVRDELVRLFAWTTLLLSTMFMVLSNIHPFFFITGYLLLNLGNASYFTMEITRMGRMVEKHEFSIIFGLATSLVIFANSIAGFVSLWFYSISTEGTFYGAFFFSALSLLVTIQSTRKWAKRRAQNSDEQVLEMNE